MSDGVYVSVHNKKKKRKKEKHTPNTNRAGMVREKREKFVKTQVGPVENFPRKNKIIPERMEMSGREDGEKEKVSWTGN